jgi:hypothetical protein
LRLRALDRQDIDHDFTTLGGCVCGGLVVVMVAGFATDYIMAEVQFWLLAALVSVQQLTMASASSSAQARGRVLGSYNTRPSTAGAS